MAVCIRRAAYVQRVSNAHGSISHADRRKSAAKPRTIPPQEKILSTSAHSLDWAHRMERLNSWDLGTLVRYFEAGMRTDAQGSGKSSCE
jgi:hypothetical protein